MLFVLQPVQLAMEMITVSVILVTMAGTCMKTLVVPPVRKGITPQELTVTVFFFYISDLPNNYFPSL
jgi:hypothetical protein